MPNKALNQVSQVQSTELANVKTFLAVMNNGEIKQMSKEDMSAVVGGLLKPLSAKLVKSVEELDSLEPSLSNPIIPFYTGFISNIAGSDSNYGWGLVGQYYGQEGRCQVVFTYGADVYIRRKKNNSSDYDIWRKIQIGG